MPVLVTRTKIIVPRRRTDLFSRQRLFDMLFELMDNKLVILAAPAGYGKTSLLIDFASQVDLTVCWYSIDELDRDLVRFLAHFIDSIASKFPGFGKQALAFLESNLTSRLDLDNLIAIIVNEAYDFIREHFLLVLDDYHLVNDHKEISYFISRFIQEIDENCHLILSSRTLLTLPDLPLMVARSMVGGLSFEELIFLPDEIQSLVMQNYNLALPRAMAEELSHATEGWITGLLLSTQAMQQGMPDRLRLSKVSRVRLYDYLTQQVLEQQPDSIKSFLMRTSLLEEFDLQFCEDVFGTNGDQRALFDYVLNNNLFVLPVGEDGRWIRYHHLFRDYLQTRLSEEHPEEKIRILNKLITLYARQEEWEKAYSLCGQLNDSNTTARLIDQAGPQLIRNGRPGLVAEWIDKIPLPQLSKNPQLISLRAVPEFILGNADRALEYLNQAIRLLSEIDDQAGLARSYARRATVLRFLGKYRESLWDADEGQRLIGDDPELQTYRADALRAAGGSLFQIGKIQEAMDNWHLAIEIYETWGDRQNVATLLMELGLALAAEGRYRQALENYQRALAYWQEVNNTVRQANLLNNLGVLHHLIGNYEQAASTLEEALAQARQNRYTRMEAYILSSIGDLYADLDANKAALDAYQKSRDLARTIAYHFLILYTDLAAAARFRAMGNLEQAQRFLATADSRVSDKSSPYECGLVELETGRYYLAKQDYKRSIEWFKSAIRHLEATEQPVETARARLQYANACYLAGDLPTALQQLQVALSQAVLLDSQHVLVVNAMEAKELLRTAQSPPYEIPLAKTLFDQVVAFEASIPSLRKIIRPRAATIPFAPPKLVIHGLGKILVERDGKAITAPEWQNQRKVRELFFLLLSNPHGFTKQEIGLVFWPESSTSQLKLQFKNTIYRLRHALGPDVVLFDDDLYWFNRDLDYDYDVESFLDGFADAQSTGSEDQKIKLLSGIVNLYQGVFLPEADGNWVIIERERLRKLFVQATLELAQLMFDARDYTASLECCLRALQEEPCLEEAHRLIMQIYSIRGNRVEINRQFERCRLALKNEVNAAPSPQTVALYESLIR